MTDVRSRSGTPVDADFSGRNGTPLVVDTDTSASYVYAGGEVVEVGQRAGWQDLLDLHYQSDGMLTNERNRTFTKKRGQL